jgi:hypothetical protein
MTGRTLARSATAATIALATIGCMTYRGPRGAEDVIEERLGQDLDRTFGISLGPITTKIAVSFVDEEDAPDLSGLTGVGVAVFEVDGPWEGARPPLTARDFGKGWETVLSSRSADEQVLVLVKTRGSEIREMLLVAIDASEVVLARLRGRIDRIVESAIAAAEHDGARGARRAVGFDPSGI